ncbi:MAG: universal stress protein [Thermodesulfobacteriota bacterium]
MKNILLCLDNSDDSTAGIDLAIEMALSDSARLTGLHVYAARLHNERFKQMEGGLPERFQVEKELKRQREIHDDLITKGLEIISDSYMTVLHAKAATVGLTPKGLSREGKNYTEIVSEANDGPYDLVVLGALGLGRTGQALTGSVCERVVRRVKKDILVVREGLSETGSGIVVAIDGSPRSFGALKQGIKLAKVFNCALDIISVYDPNFHYSAFRSIAGILTEEASKVFRFEEQKELHNNIIDRGLARIYGDHLESASAMAGELGVKARSELLSGKAFDGIAGYVRAEKPRFLVLGKTGVHSGPELDIGSVTENCLRHCQTNILISANTYTPAAAAERGHKESGPPWRPEAEARLLPIPPFARDAARVMIIEAALDAGVREITSEFIERFKKDLGL